MEERDSDKNREYAGNKDRESGRETPEHAETSAPSPEPAGLTLEQVIDITGEFAHLNELVMIHIEHAGGFTGADAYFRTVQPVLDLLEVEIRVRCTAATTPQQMKLIVQDWIDLEIKALAEKKAENRLE